MRCDNTGENLALTQQCAAEDLGIEFEFTAPDTPQQNGVVERAFATQIGKEKQPCCRF